MYTYIHTITLDFIDIYTSQMLLSFQYAFVVLAFLNQLVASVFMLTSIVPIFIL